MKNNIFLENTPEFTFEDYMSFNKESRGNMGNMLPLQVYRLLEYSLREELLERWGKNEQIAIFRKAGYRAGTFFASHFLDLTLQQRMEEMKMGVLRLEQMDEAAGKFVLTVAEDADCSGLPVLGETVCNYDEGFIAGVLSTYTGRQYTAVEVDCWATGDRVCRFRAEVQQD